MSYVIYNEKTSYLREEKKHGGGNILFLQNLSRFLKVKLGVT